MNEALSAQAIQAQLSGLIKDLYYVSAIDAPFAFLPIPSHLGADALPAYLITATGQPAGAKVEVLSLEKFFRSQFQQVVKGDAEAQSRATRFRTLQDFLEQHLPDITVYRIGQRQLQVVI